MAQQDSPILKGTLLVTSTLTVMAGATVAPALPAMRTFFAQEDPDGFLVRLVLTLPALFIAIGAPIAGYITDRMGRKPLLIFSAILYGFAGGAGYFVDSLSVLLVSRAFLGIAVAGLMTSVTTLIADYFEGKQRANFMGFQASFMGLGGTVFLTVGGALADIGWREPFLIYLSAFVILPFIVTVLFEPERGKSTGEMSPLITDPGDCISEAIRCNEEDNPPLSEHAPPIRLLAFIYGIIVMIQIVFYTIPVQLPFHLQELTGATASASGIAIAGMTLFFATASALFSWFDQRFDHITMIIFAFAMTGSGFILLGLAENWFLIALALPIGGFGIGLLMPNMNVWLANESPAHLRGRVLSGFATSVFLGQFLSPIFSQPLVNATDIATTYLLIGLFLASLSVAVVLLRQQVTQLTASQRPSSEGI